MRTASLYGLIVVALLAAGLTAVLDADEPAEVVGAPRTSVRPSSTIPTTSAATTPSTSITASEPDEGITAAQIGVLSAAATTTAPSAEKMAQPTSPQSQPTTQPPATVAPTTTAPPPPSTTVAQGGPDSEFESQFASLINSYRADNGLPGLTGDGSLASRARSWSEDMAAGGGLSHSNLGSLLPPWSGAAENVGMGGSVDAVFEALAGSSGHRSNMLGDYTHYGVGVWVDSSGAIWTTHVFTR